MVLLVVEHEDSFVRDDGLVDLFGRMIGGKGKSKWLKIHINDASEKKITCQHFHHPE